ncbi:SH3 domain-containing protein [Rhodobacter sp. SGA-6-6]|uniref:SH3 domain-containing protein n=1 Tax=Rhodobacter sp. SGA-6-6 TaxID=2710882 RepID=UPI0013EC230E|nr:SH3 domain-containing protein [Rhodobacter sp. SGA-6-6]NGM47374.1 SH3 domain-containing protein [Rhodobacter sp. SGA-6-6]
MRIRTWVALAVGTAALWGITHSPPLHAQGSEAEAEVPGDAAAQPAAKKEKDCKPGFGCVTNLPLPRFVSLKGDEGNARRGPGLTHRIDWVFTRPGMPLKITAEFDNWRRVEDQDGAGGWVHYALLSGVRSVVVTLDMAELRSSPDPAAPVVAQAELGVIGRVLECLPDWCRIQSGGERGWVAKTALWGVLPGEVIE